MVYHHPKNKKRRSFTGISGIERHCPENKNVLFGFLPCQKGHRYPMKRNNQ
jgi:hypothetical protein